ncbi:MAG: anti-sigma factor RsbA family regulatory protein [Blastococcus sp.]
MTQTPEPDNGQAPCRRAPHDALLYDSPGQLAEVAAAFLLEGLAAGDVAVLATSEGTAGLLLEAVDGDRRVQVVPRAQVYGARTPAALSAVRKLGERRPPGSSARVRVVGEVDFGPSERHWPEWQRYEAVVNEALTGWPLWGLCVFDTQRLPAPLLETARRTHSHVLTEAGRRPNPEFTAPADYLRSLPLPDEPLEDGPPLLCAHDVGDFRALRHAVGRELAALPGHREELEDFLLAVDEMVSNADRHGGPPVSLGLWTSADRIVCSIGDGGPGWDDPFAGFGPAHGADLSRGGMGLWLARQLCDHVDIAGHGGHDGGLRVRLTTRLD